MIGTPSGFLYTPIIRYACDACRFKERQAASQYPLVQVQKQHCISFVFHSSRRKARVVGTAHLQSSASAICISHLAILPVVIASSISTLFVTISVYFVSLGLI